MIVYVPFARALEGNLSAGTYETIHPCAKPLPYGLRYECGPTPQFPSGTTLVICCSRGGTNPRGAQQREWILSRIELCFISLPSLEPVNFPSLTLGRHVWTGTELPACRLILKHEAGIPAVGLSPLGHYTTSAREVSVSGAGAVADCLRAGLVPVLHGDAVLDEQLGCTILSGDTLVRDLAEQLRPQYVVFLTNVAGVYDRPPEEEGARLLRRIVVRRKDGSWRVTAADGGSELDIRMTADTHDVTGGIALKVEEAARVARLGVPVLIAQAGTEDGAAACRLGPLVAVDGIFPVPPSEPGWGPGCLAAKSNETERQQINAAAGQQCAAAWRGTLVVLDDDEGLEKEALGGVGSAG
ncbi:hypothetical protein Vretimale_15171 [Volvox reticuliferus]|uniref:Aspartate/glutamate/uridylate kinase domain-containing protein n=1 Tax=Volvox reticuliferus TaxID=1737510 RepID=A0A8J4C685_9CHLO|nr:hypothetical protein Vretifemale_5348 [Volvox reticuliferus]GIM11660.1 hypothetical protein Vretimale_15171 [Volvox reticuliferus]